jgi:hypothetical protein
MPTLIPAAIFLEAAPFVGNDMFRYATKGVHCCVANGTPRLVATNGHNMIVINVPTAIVDGDAVTVLVTPWLRDACRPRAIPWTRKTDPHKDTRWLRIDGKTVSVVATDDRKTPPSPDALPVVTFYGGLYDGEYPDYMRCFSGTPAPGPMEPFNPKLLLPFSQFTKTGPMQFLPTGGTLGPVWVLFQDRPDVIGIVMPMRGEALSIPTWFK